MEEKAVKQKKDTRRLRHGSYSIALIVLVVAGAIVLNLIAGQLPSRFTKIDVSGDQLTVLSDQTKELLGGLTEDVTLYYIVQDSDRDGYVSMLLERYQDYSPHIRVEEKDPVVNPQFASQYTDETLTDNSVIVVCGDRSRVVSYNDMYEYEFNYSYYTYTTSGFDAEGQITSAIAAMAGEDLPKLYTLSGHNELSLSETLQQSVEKENIVMEELNLITADAVPDDADCLLICSPTTDLTDEETEKIERYLESGGNAIIITDYVSEELDNLYTVLADYGVTLTDGIVLEGNSNYYVQIPYYLVPDIKSTEVSADMSDNSAYVLLVAAQGIETDGENVTEVLTTSDASYAKTDVQNMDTYEKEDGDVDGPFALGVLITETPGKEDEEEAVEETEEVKTEEAETEESGGNGDGETRLALYTSSALVDDSANQMVSGGNYRLFVNTLSWACGREASVSVPSKSLSMDYLTITAASANFWSIVTIVIIPAAMLAIGLFIWLGRRKR